MIQISSQMVTYSPVAKLSFYALFNTLDPNTYAVEANMGDFP